MQPPQHLSKLKSDMLFSVSMPAELQLLFSALLGTDVVEKW